MFLGTVRTEGLSTLLEAWPVTCQFHPARTTTRTEIRTPQRATGVDPETQAGLSSPVPNRDDSLTDFYLVDFVAVEGQPKPLVNLAMESQENNFSNHANGNGSLTREQLVELLAGPNGEHTEIPLKVEETIRRALEAYNQ